MIYSMFIICPKRAGGYIRGWKSSYVWSNAFTALMLLSMLQKSYEQISKVGATGKIYLTNCPSKITTQNFLLHHPSLVLLIPNGKMIFQLFLQILMDC